MSIGWLYDYVLETISHHWLWYMFPYTLLNCYVCHRAQIGRYANNSIESFLCITQKITIANWAQWWWRLPRAAGWWPRYVIIMFLWGQNPRFYYKCKSNCPCPSATFYQRSVLNRFGQHLERREIKMSWNPRHDEDCISSKSVFRHLLNLSCRFQTW